MKQGSTKWTDLRKALGWHSDVPSLRQFVLLVMYKYSERNPTAAAATVRFYFDEDAESTPTERNYHVRARDILYTTYQFVVSEYGVEVVDRLYALPLNEQDLYGSIVNG